MSEYLSFEEVLGELNISEEDLKRMVSEGELRAFRDENKMKFRTEDVKNLKAGGTAEPTVVFGGDAPGGGAGDSEGTILDMESGELPAAPQETGVPELDFGGGEAPAAEPAAEGQTTGITQEMVFEDSDALKVQPSEGQGLGGSESSETFVEESSDTAAQTEGLQVDNEPGAAEEGGETAVTEEEAPAPRRAPRAAAGAEEGGTGAPQSHPIVTSMLFLAAAAMALVGFIMVDLIRSEMTPDHTKAASLTQGLRDKLVGKGKPADGPGKPVFTEGAGK